MLNNVNIISTKQIIPGGDLSFYLMLEAKSGNPVLENQIKR